MSESWAVQFLGSQVATTHYFYMDFTRKPPDVKPSEHKFTEHFAGMPRASEAESVLEPGL